MGGLGGIILSNSDFRTSLKRERKRAYLDSPLETTELRPHGDVSGRLTGAHQAINCVVYDEPTIWNLFTVFE